MAASDDGAGFNRRVSFSGGLVLNSANCATVLVLEPRVIRKMWNFRLTNRLSADDFSKYNVFPV